MIPQKRNVLVLEKEFDFCLSSLLYFDSVLIKERGFTCDKVEHKKKSRISNAINYLNDINILHFQRTYSHHDFEGYDLFGSVNNSFFDVPADPIFGDDINFHSIFSKVSYPKIITDNSGNSIYADKWNMYLNLSDKDKIIPFNFNSEISKNRELINQLEEANIDFGWEFHDVYKSLFSKSSLSPIETQTKVTQLVNEIKVPLMPIDEFIYFRNEHHDKFRLFKLLLDEICSGVSDPKIAYEQINYELTQYNRAATKAHKTCSSHALQWFSGISQDILDSKFLSAIGKIFKLGEVNVNYDKDSWLDLPGHKCAFLYELNKHKL